MDHFDEQPLQRTAEHDPSLLPPRKPSIGPVLLIAALGLIAGGLGAWWWTRGDVPPAAAAVPTTSTDAALADVSEPARSLPPVDQMDTYLRALLGALSSHPDLLRWLATDDLIRQMANGIARISRGQSPAAHVTVLRPEGDITVARRQSTMTVDAASFARYNRLTGLVESLEPRGVAEAYRTIQPRLDEAYRALGQSESGVDVALDQALHLLIDTPVPADTIVVVPGPGATYAFADPALERLPPIQKQLVRMGRDNVRRIQARLRAIRDELTRSDSRDR